MKDAYKNLILMITSTLITGGAFFILGEVLLGMQHEQWKAEKEKELHGEALTIASEDPILLWEFKPNASGSAPGSPLIKTNRYGFRDRDYDVSRPEGVYRIAFIGDSVTLGLYVEGEQIFVRKFEQAAQKIYPNLQAMNFGVDGYDADQITELLRSRVLKFQPSKVIYVMCLNDFDFDDASGQKILYFRKPTSFVLAHLQKVLLRPLFKDGSVEYHSWYFWKNKETVFERIIDMQKLLREKGVAFQVVVVPIFDFGNGNNFSEYPLRTMHLEIDDFLHRSGIEYLDLLDSFAQQHQPASYFALDVWHPNAIGHALIAEQLVSWLSRCSNCASFPTAMPIATA
jgi:lysophospholipase L1-like esterase